MIDEKDKKIQELNDKINKAKDNMKKHTKLDWRLDDVK